MTARASNIGGTLIAEKRNGSRRFHVHDSLGSTIALVNDAGSTTDTYSYWPYGEIRTSTGSTSSTPFKFCGAWGYYDDGNQLYVRARYLRQQLGRWITKDPLWPGENAYGYVNCSPESSIDSKGTFACNDHPCGHSEKEACDWAKDNGYAKDVHGMIICCNGVAYACAWSGPGHRKGIVNCVKAHEEAHRPFVNCPLSGFTDRVIEPDIGHESECLSLRREINCYITNQKECKELPRGRPRDNCYSEYRGAIRDACDKMKKEKCTPLPQICKEII